MPQGKPPGATDTPQSLATAVITLKCSIDMTFKEVEESIGVQERTASGKYKRARDSAEEDTLISLLHAVKANPYPGPPVSS
jgi:hypothetical protein